MMGFHFRSGPVTSYEQARQADSAWFAQFHRGCLERGVFLPASPYEAMFISTAHTQPDLESALTQMRAALQEAVS
jgi:glutamate-1-semialdehyde 2,1-aminomutase